MNRKDSFFTTIFIMALAIFAGTTQAGIVIDISDDNGYAKFSLSGSDVTTDAGGFVNGFWIEGILTPGLVNDKGPNSESRQLITSGTAGFAINGEYFEFDDLWISYFASETFDGRFSFRNHYGDTHQNLFENNTHIELFGTITTDILFSEFNAGTYHFNHFGVVNETVDDGIYNTPLAEGITINVEGYNQAISEPGALTLMGLGLLSMIGLHRKRSQSEINSNLSN